MLSRKFLREGEMPGPAASATSGIIIEAVRAAAVSPVTAFSLREALASNLRPDLGSPAIGLFLDSLTGSGLKRHSDGFLWAEEEDEINGMDMETAEAEAIFDEAMIACGFGGRSSEFRGELNFESSAVCLRGETGESEYSQ
ncbi:hypothetical protein SAY87_009711 [Trapa incisa]|uniref:Uncharacterized protein n=1 Tax=Trapa incisa TaxID=236973 RepID=A0AAN7K0C6_9MYRT|nr:hypothetical protein SAY87_009711 [Trapa incisa]